MRHSSQVNYSGKLAQLQLANNNINANDRTEQCTNKGSVI